MKLKNLVEIEIVAKQDTILHQDEEKLFDLNYSKKFMSINGFPLLQYDAIDSDLRDSHLYRLIDNENIILNMVGHRINGSHFDGFFIERFLVDKFYQKCGFAKAVHQVLFYEKNYNLFSDKSLSTNMLKAWKSKFGITQCFAYGCNTDLKIFKLLDEIEDIDYNPDWIYCILHEEITQDIEEQMINHDKNSSL